MTIKLFLNDEQAEVKSFVFNGGEVQVKLPPDGIKRMMWRNQALTTIKILAHLRNSQDIMELLMVTDALRRELVGMQIPIHVQIPYFPYARQDRVCDRGEALGVKVVADLINSQNYASVTIWDPHSDVTPALLNNCHVIESYMFVDKIFSRSDFDKANKILVSPDAGANKKVQKVAQVLRVPDVVRADKTRDVATGKITGTVAYTEHVGDKDFLILDDICDGGRTFVELARTLSEKTDGKIYLYVTHGIFSAGFNELSHFIDHIYTANSFVDIPEEWSHFVTVL